MTKYLHFKKERLLKRSLFLVFSRCVGVFILCFLLVPIGVIAQRGITRELDSVSRISTQRVDNFLSRNPTEQRLRKSEAGTYLLVDINENGHPIYEHLHNHIASVNVGAAALRTGGELGLGLSGEGVKMALWDGGRVRQDHLELVGRILNSDGAAIFDNHATHVAGTMAATGINSNATGMATRAQLFAFDFSNDLSEMASMAATDQSGLIVSNHSYGTLSGWHFDGGWTWYGDPQVSATEDYKFGFYDSKARLFDQLTFNSPYYTVVKSAGNERDNVGDGSRPPDPQFGSISTFGNAKNIITVGAVNKIASSLVNPAAIQMSSFSSWGPTDDGRIKPDLVAPGVNIFSTYSSSTSAYGNLSGTSMATPVVTGCIGLLQELYRQINGGRYMRSSTVRALLIHTASEAGGSNGPDYQFGWGLLNARAAAEFVLAENSGGKVQIESRLNENEFFEMAIDPKLNSRLRITLAWTDPAGTVPPISLNPLQPNLVNDLDVVLVDDSGVVALPWVLDPTMPGSPAVSGNNVRDNVERIDFSGLNERTYLVRVTHKGQMLNGFQDFSLLIDYEPAVITGTTYHWVGGNGDWSDPSHWAASSGGSPGVGVPTSLDRVIFDENSFSDTGGVVSISRDERCGSISVFYKQSLAFNLNLNTLSVSGNFLNTSQEAFFVNGTIDLSSTAPNAIFSSSQENFDLIDFIVSGTAHFDFQSNISCKSMLFRQGSIDLSSIELTSAHLVVQSQVEGVNVESAQIQLRSVGELIIEDGVDVKSNANTEIVLRPNTNSKVLLAEGNFMGSIRNESAELQISGGGVINRIVGEGVFYFVGDMQIEQLRIDSGSELVFPSNKEVVILSDLELNSTATKRIALRSDVSDVRALLRPSFHKLKCFDFLDISQVDVVDGTFFNAGTNSQIQAADGWLSVSCDDVVFPDFSFESPCAASKMILRNTSTGPVQSVSWRVDGITHNGDEIFVEIGDRSAVSVNIQVSDISGKIMVFTKVIDIVPNLLPPASYIVLNNGRLVSFLQGDKYYWLLDNVLSDRRERAIAFESHYRQVQVLVFRGQCNRPSDPYIITAVEPQSQQIEGVFPVPFQEQLFVRSPRLGCTVQIYDSRGVQVDDGVLEDNVVSFDLSHIATGTYFVVLRCADGSVKVFRVFKT
mgnify:CR=1 FL=1